MAPKISVLLPTYQYARFLSAAIESVLVQTETDFELIVRDDASSDGSAELIARYAACDPRIRVLPAERNLGMVANWNHCLAAAQGRYIKYVFGDDCLAERDALERYAAMLDEHDSAVMAVSARLIIDAQARVLDGCDEIGVAGLHGGPGMIARCLWLDRNVIGEPTAVMFRRVAAARGFDPGLRQIVDLEMWFHLLEQGNLVYEPRPLCAFRRHEGQQTEVNRELRIGALESLQVTARHLPLINHHLGAAARARVVYRILHYSRKRNPRIPEILAAEASLAGHASHWSRLRCGVAHRLARPWQNLVRRWRKFRRAPLVRPPNLSWRPLRESRGKTEVLHHDSAY